MHNIDMEFDLGPTGGVEMEDIVAEIGTELEVAKNVDALVSVINGQIILSVYAPAGVAHTREDILKFVISSLFARLTRRKVYLVDALAYCAKIDTSIARKEIVMGNVEVNRETVTNPGAQLNSAPGSLSLICYRGNLYPVHM